MILLHLLDRPRIEPGQRLGEQGRAHPREPGRQQCTRVREPDRTLRLGKDGARVHLLHHAHHRDAGDRVAAGDGPGDRRRAAQGRQQRCVEIDGP